MANPPPPSSFGPPPPQSPGQGAPTPPPAGYIPAPPAPSGPPAYISGPPGYPGGAYPGGAVPPKHLRGRRPLLIGTIFAVLGIVLIVVGGIIGSTAAVSKVPNFSRVSVAAGSGTAQFDKAGGYLAYYESSNISNSTRTLPLVQVTLTNPSTGAQMTLTTPYGQRSDGKFKQLYYSKDGHNGLAMWQFHIDTPGAWQVQLNAGPGVDSDAVMAFGPSIASGIAIAGVTVIVGVLALIAGIVLLIVGWVKHSRHKGQLRRLVVAAPFGYGPPGFAMPGPGPSGPAQPGPAPSGPAPGSSQSAGYQSYWDSQPPS